MTKHPFLTLLAAAALVVPAGVATAPSEAQAPRDWSRTVVATPEGGFRMGNPNAPVKVVEYMSLTCSHCAEFARTGTPALVRNYVRTGRVSLEYRNYVLNGLDVTASLLARCGGTAGFFPIAEQLYATQSQWTGRLQGLTQAQRNEIMALDEGSRIVRIADLLGINAIAAQHGVSAQQGRRCLTDPAGRQQLNRIGAAANAAGVSGTPTFFINGTMANVNDWPSIEALIRQAGGG